MALGRRAARTSLLVTALLAGALVSATATRADSADLAFTGPDAGAVLSGTAVPLRVHAAAGIRGGWWWVDGAALDPDHLFDSTSDGEDHVFLIDTTFLAAGQHTFSFRYADGSSVSRAFSVRNVPPTVVFGPSAATGAASGVVTLPVEASPDPQGTQHVASVEFSVDGTFVAADDTAPFDVAVDTRRLGNGPHQVSARAVDSVGLIGAPATTSLDVQNAPSAVSGSVRQTPALAGSGVAVRGALTTPDGGQPIAGAGVALYARRADQTTWRRVATTVSGPYGGLLANPKPLVTTRYQWRFDGGAGHQAAASRPLLATVRPRLTLALGTGTARAGAGIAGSVTVTPATAGQPLAVQVRRAGGRWQTVRTLRSTAGVTRVRFSLPSAGTYDVRVRRNADVLGTTADSNTLRRRAV